jgi:hypothetical protein
MRLSERSDVLALCGVEHTLNEKGRWPQGKKGKKRGERQGGRERKGKANIDQRRPGLDFTRFKGGGRGA